MPVSSLWSPEEDAVLNVLVAKHGPKKWAQIAVELGTKGSKQCRRRWKNFIAIDERKQGIWTAEEDAALLDGHRRHGNKWTAIAQEIGGRTDNAVKNRWAALTKRRHGEDDGGSSSPERPPYAGRAANDLLGARRAIAKDQPRLRGAAAAAAAGLLQQQAPPGAWLQPPAGFAAPPEQVQLAMPPRPCQLLHQTSAEHHALNNGQHGATALEVPYSQQRAAAGYALLRAALPPPALQLPGDADGPLPLGAMEQDSQLSTSRQAAHDEAMAALASPGEGPGGLNALYQYLCTPTPQGAAAQLAGGRRSPPPWAAAGAGAPQLAPPPPPPPQQHALPLPSLAAQLAPGFRQLPIAQLQPSGSALPRFVPVAPEPGRAPPAQLSASAPGGQPGHCWAAGPCAGSPAFGAAAGAFPPADGAQPQRQWGPEELRQLVALLGDQQAGGAPCGGGAPLQPHAPPACGDEEVDQVNINNVSHVL
ncbi:MYB118 [Scenedesmus sp. PABB004]|nr:MYB118 [Scenedesmus sp. PABB004]